jgi:Rrf2 family protein
MSGPANTRFAIAVHLLTLLANSGNEPVGSDVAAASIGANPVHVRRVVAYLRRADLVTSKAGVGGGIQLAYEPADITLTEVWDAVEGDEPVVAVHQGANPKCEVGRGITRTLEGLSARATDAVRAELADVTIADVLAETLATPRVRRTASR